MLKFYSRWCGYLDSYMFWENKKRNKFRWIVISPGSIVGFVKTLLKHDMYAHWYILGFAIFYMVYIPLVGLIISCF